MAKKSTPAKSSGRAEKPKKKTTPGAFVRQVRQEAAKVTWPTRKDTLVTTGMVVVMAAAAATFLSLVDLVIQNVVDLLLSLGG